MNVGEWQSNRCCEHIEAKRKCDIESDQRQPEREAERRDVKANGAQRYAANRELRTIKKFFGSQIQFQLKSKCRKITEMDNSKRELQTKELEKRRKKRRRKLVGSRILYIDTNSRDRHTNTTTTTCFQEAKAKSNDNQSMPIRVDTNSLRVSGDANCRMIIRNFKQNVGSKVRIFHFIIGFLILIRLNLIRLDEHYHGFAFGLRQANTTSFNWTKTKDLEHISGLNFVEKNGDLDKKTFYKPMLAAAAESPSPPSLIESTSNYNSPVRPASVFVSRHDEKLTLSETYPLPVFNLKLTDEEREIETQTEIQTPTQTQTQTQSQSQSQIRSQHSHSPASLDQPRTKAQAQTEAQTKTEAELGPKAETQVKRREQTSIARMSPSDRQKNVADSSDLHTLDKRVMPEIVGQPTRSTGLETLAEPSRYELEPTGQLSSQLGVLSAVGSNRVSPMKHEVAAKASDDDSAPRIECQLDGLQVGPLEWPQLKAGASVVKASSDYEQPDAEWNNYSGDSGLANDSLGGESRTDNYEYDNGYDDSGTTEIEQVEDDDDNDEPKNDDDYQDYGYYVVNPDNPNDLTDVHSVLATKFQVNQDSFALEARSHNVQVNPNLNSNPLELAKSFGSNYRIEPKLRGQSQWVKGQKLVEKTHKFSDNDIRSLVESVANRASDDGKIVIDADKAQTQTDTSSTTVGKAFSSDTLAGNQVMFFAALSQHRAKKHRNRQEADKNLDATQESIIILSENIRKELPSPRDNINNNNNNLNEDNDYKRIVDVRNAKHSEAFIDASQQQMSAELQVNANNAKLKRKLGPKSSDRSASSKLDSSKGFDDSESRPRLSSRPTKKVRRNKSHAEAIVSALGPELDADQDAFAGPTRGPNEQQEATEIGGRTASVSSVSTQIDQVDEQQTRNVERIEQQQQQQHHRPFHSSSQMSLNHQRAAVKVETETETEAEAQAQAQAKAEVEVEVELKSEGGKQDSSSLEPELALIKGGHDRKLVDGVKEPMGSSDLEPRPKMFQDENYSTSWLTTRLNLATQRAAINRSSSDVNDELNNEWLVTKRQRHKIHYWHLVWLILPLGATFGNLLVIMAVYLERSLQSVTNYFIVSLAFADLSVGLIVMPFAVYVLVNEMWQLGNFVCDIFVAVDVTSSTASILNLVAISIDRYRAVAHPIAYGARSNSRRAILTILLVWLISCCVGAPIILGLNNKPSRRTEDCMLYDDTFIFWSSLTSFYVPCVIMLGLYWRIFLAIKTRTKKAIQSSSDPRRQTADNVETTKQTLTHRNAEATMATSTMNAFHRSMIQADSSDKPNESADQFKCHIKHELTNLSLLPTTTVTGTTTTITTSALCCSSNSNCPNNEADKSHSSTSNEQSIEVARESIRKVSNSSWGIKTNEHVSASKGFVILNLQRLDTSEREVSIKDADFTSTLLAKILVNYKSEIATTNPAASSPISAHRVLLALVMTSHSNETLELNCRPDDDNDHDVDYDRACGLDDNDLNDLATIKAEWKMESRKTNEASKSNYIYKWHRIRARHTRSKSKVASDKFHTNPSLGFASSIGELALFALEFGHKILLWPQQSEANCDNSDLELSIDNHNSEPGSHCARCRGPIVTNGEISRQQVISVCLLDNHRDELTYLEATQSSTGQWINDIIMEKFKLQLEPQNVSSASLNLVALVMPNGKHKLLNSSQTNEFRLECQYLDDNNNYQNENDDKSTKSDIKICDKCQRNCLYASIVHLQIPPSCSSVSASTGAKKFHHQTESSALEQSDVVEISADLNCVDCRHISELLNRERRKKWASQNAAHRNSKRSCSSSTSPSVLSGSGSGSSLRGSSPSSPNSSYRACSVSSRPTRLSDASRSIDDDRIQSYVECTCPTSAAETREPESVSSDGLCCRAIGKSRPNKQITAQCSACEQLARDEADLSASTSLGPLNHFGSTVAPPFDEDSKLSRVKQVPQKGSDVTVIAANATRSSIHDSCTECQESNRRHSERLEINLKAKRSGSSGDKNQSTCPSVLPDLRLDRGSIATPGHFSVIELSANAIGFSVSPAMNKKRNSFRKSLGRLMKSSGHAEAKLKTQKSDELPSADDTLSTYHQNSPYSPYPESLDNMRSAKRHPKGAKRFLIPSPSDKRSTGELSNGVEQSLAEAGNSRQTNPHELGLNHHSRPIDMRTADTNNINNNNNQNLSTPSSNQPNGARLRDSGNRRRREKNAAKRERKATKTLAIVMGIFLVCWTPFFTCNIIGGICIKLNNENCVPMILYLFTSWLGYVNSCVNPIIYTIFNMEFRRAFKKILTTSPMCCWCFCCHR